MAIKDNDPGVDSCEDPQLIVVESAVYSDRQFFHKQLSQLILIM